MSERTSRSFRLALAGEIDRWEGEGIIDHSLSATLRGMYPISAEQNRLIGILMTLGAVLIGLGAILFIGSNWQHLTSLWKVSLIVIAVLSSNYAGWYCKFEPGRRPKLGSALLLLGSLFYGAGIWLISQILHLDFSLADGLVLWFAGTAPLALITTSGALGLLSALLIAAWNFNNLAYWNFESMGYGLSPYSESKELLFFSGTLAFSLFLAYRLRSKSTLIATLVGALIWLFASKAGALGAIALACLAFACYLWPKNSSLIMSAPYLYTGMIGTFIGMMCITFGWTREWGTTGYVISALAILAMTAIATVNKELRKDMTACLIIVVSSLCLGLVADSTLRIALANLVFCRIAGNASLRRRSTLQKPRYGKYGHGLHRHRHRLLLLRLFVRYV